MKLVIGGSTGYVGTELVRQALDHAAITSIVALGRRDTTVPEGSSDPSNKLQSVICDNFENYSQDVKEKLTNADACIWTIAVTPAKSEGVPWEDQCRISRDFAVTAAKVLAECNTRKDHPVRFVYMSGHFSQRQRDDSVEIVKRFGMLDSVLMRGEAETLILQFASNSNGAIDAAVAKPGHITSAERPPPPIPELPNVDLTATAAALIHQVVNGFEKDTLSNYDLIRIGRAALG